VWAGDELFVIQYDNLAARFDFTRWEEINLPLRFWECNFPDLLVVGELPVARACGGLAIWDHIRASWIPIPLPMELSTGIVWPKLVATDDAIYAFGEKVLRYPIERLGDGSVANPPTIPVGVMQLDIPLGFSLRSTVGLARLSLSDGSVGEVVTFVLDGLGGSCLVDAWYGRELTEEQRAMIEEQAEGDWLVTRLSGTEPTGYWLVGASTSDTIWIDCQSPEDAEILAESFWLP
jgi:hypothetical protein